jgi:predicted nucleic acid-binding protein
MIVDVSVVLRGFFPDEEGHAKAQALIRAYAQGEIELHAPTLLPYEVTNAVLQAIRRDRIAPEKGQEILVAFQGLSIPTVKVRQPYLGTNSTTVAPSPPSYSSPDRWEATRGWFVTKSRTARRSVPVPLP